MVDQEIHVLGSLPTYQARSTPKRHMVCSCCFHKMENIGHYWACIYLILHKNLKHSCILWIHMKCFVCDLDFAPIVMGFDYRFLIGIEFLSNEIESSKDVPMNYVMNFQ